MLNTHANVSNEQPSLVALNIWINQVGVTPITAWRWRKKGWLRPVNICGRLYLTAENIAEFKRRAEQGEFAKEHKVPPAPNAELCTA